MTDSHTITVDEDSAGLRLDKFLSTALPDISRARLQGMIEEGAVMKKELTREASSVCLPPPGEAIDGGLFGRGPATTSPHPNLPPEGEGIPLWHRFLAITEVSLCHH